MSTDNAICYQGFAYTLDGYTWPAPDTQEEAALRTAGIALSQCLGGTTPATCGVYLTAFNTDRDQLLGLVP